ncbi:MAG: hypothetical protein EA399_07265 [Desulfovibrionales bacterium]|nr:MAG: hypothetical protein EA399_07265 [Desulfovibrionales bacterium]
MLQRAMGVYLIGGEMPIGRLPKGLVSAIKLSDKQDTWSGSIGIWSLMSEVAESKWGVCRWQRVSGIRSCIVLKVSNQRGMEAKMPQTVSEMGVLIYQARGLERTPEGQPELSENPAIARNGGT